MPGTMVVVAGPMASGKSTLAGQLAPPLGAELLSADETRRELREAGNPEAYVPGFSDTLYPELLQRAGQLLAAGRPVVLDGSFRSRAMRAAARRLAAESEARFLFVECRAEPEVCRRRLRQREREQGRRGWLEMFEEFLELWEPVDELPDSEHLVIDTTRRPDEGLARVLRRLA